MTTTPLLRRMHAVGRKRGYDHEALRDLAGVDSLKRLTVRDALQLIERLERGANVAPVSDRPPLRLVNTPHGNAGDQQRSAIYAKLKELHELGWSAGKCMGWLLKRYGLKSPWDKEVELTNHRASEIITHLTNTIAKESPGVAPASGQCKESCHVS